VLRSHSTDSAPALRSMLSSLSSDSLQYYWQQSTHMDPLYKHSHYSRNTLLKHDYNKIKKNISRYSKFAAKPKADLLIIVMICVSVIILLIQ